MADNTLLNPGVGGDLIATDDVAALGAKVQWIKVGFGADGAFVPVQNVPGSGMPSQPVVGPLQVSSALTNVGDTFPIDVAGATQVLLQFASQNYVSPTLIVEGRSDPSASYATLTFIASPGGAIGSNVQINSNTHKIPVAGMSDVRVRLTAVSGGSGILNARSVYGNTDAVMVQSVGSIFPGTTATSLGKAEDAAHASGDVGLFALVVRNDSNLDFTSTDGDYSPIAADQKGNVYVQARAKSANVYGFTTTAMVSAASTNATSLKGTTGNLQRIIAVNANAAVRYLKLYNKATAPTVGTDTPTHIIGIPGGGVPLIVDGSMLPLSFGAGIAYALTTGLPVADTGAVAAGEIAMTTQHA